MILRVRIDEEGEAVVSAHGMDRGRVIAIARRGNVSRETFKESHSELRTMAIEAVNGLRQIQGKSGILEVNI